MGSSWRIPYRKDSVCTDSDRLVPAESARDIPVQLSAEMELLLFDGKHQGAVAREVQVREHVLTGRDGADFSADAGIRDDHAINRAAAFVVDAHGVARGNVNRLFLPSDE